MNLKKLDIVTKTPYVVKLAEEYKTSRNVPIALKEEALLLHSVISTKKIICQCPTRRTDKSNNGHGRQTQFSIPLGYKGLVEVLTENGQPTEPLTTIQEVAKAAPKSFLIRSRIRVLSEVEDASSLQILQRGSVLEVKGMVKVSKEDVTTMYLHCVNINGLYVYVDFDTAGVFSPLAGPKNIAGVHTIESIAKRFRLPVTVRVVSGKIPKEACQSDKPGMLRLLEMRKEKVAMFLPLSASQRLVPVRASQDIMFIRPANMKELSRNRIFQQIYDSCFNKVESYSKTMHVIVSSGDVKDNTGSMNDDELFQDVDEIYPYIRRGGLPENLRVHSLHEESMPRTITKPYMRSSSQPVLAHQRGERASSITSNHRIRQHTVSSPTKEITLQFQSSSGSLTLAKSDLLKQFIRKHTADPRASLLFSTSSTSSDQCANEDIYFTLDNPDYSCVSTVADTVHNTETNIAVRC